MIAKQKKRVQEKDQLVFSLEHLSPQFNQQARWQHLLKYLSGVDFLLQLVNTVVPGDC